MINIAAVFECGPQIGYGHACRVLALLHELCSLGFKCCIFTTSTSANILENISPSQFDLFVIDDLSSLSNTINSSTSDRFYHSIILDHYSPGVRSLLSSPYLSDSITVLIDDLSLTPAFPCTLYINPNICDDSSLCPSSSTYLMGPMYALIRSEFLPSTYPDFFKIENASLPICLISLGATDPNNFTTLILNFLAQYQDRSSFVFVIMLGSSSPHIHAIQALLSNIDLNAKLVIEPKSVSSLYRSAHCCIGAAGSSSWERSCIGLPTAQFVLADNQFHIQNTLLINKAIFELPSPEAADFKDFLYTFLDNALSNSHCLKDCANRARQIVDGKGAERVASCIASHIFSS